MDDKTATMTRLWVISSIVILCVIFVIQYQVNAEVTSRMEDTIEQTRVKRQLEDFDSDDATPDEQESGFWDRVVKVALRLFTKFMEWLNSS